MSAEEPQFYFSVARRPDLVNTADLNGVPVMHPIEHYAMNNSVALSGPAVVDSFSPDSISCSVQDPDALQLSSKSRVDLEFLKGGGGGSFSVIIPKTTSNCMF